MLMDTQLVDMLKQTGAVKFGDFTLSSGRKSKYYVDKYIFETNPLCLEAIGGRIAKMIPAGTRKLAGIEIGSIPLAAIASVKSGMPFVIVRKAQKGYGTNKLIEGVYERGEKVLVVEDVVTTARARSGPSTRYAMPAWSWTAWSASWTGKRAAGRTSKMRAFASAL